LTTVDNEVAELMPLTRL